MYNQLKNNKKFHITNCEKKKKRNKEAKINKGKSYRRNFRLGIVVPTYDNNSHSHSKFKSFIGIEKSTHFGPRWISTVAEEERQRAVLFLLMQGSLGQNIWLRGDFRMWGGNCSRWIGDWQN